MIIQYSNLSPFALLRFLGLHSYCREAKGKNTRHLLHDFSMVIKYRYDVPNSADEHNFVLN